MHSEYYNFNLIKISSKLSYHINVIIKNYSIFLIDLKCKLY